LYGSFSSEVEDEAGRRVSIGTSGTAPERGLGLSILESVFEWILGLILQWILGLILEWIFEWILKTKSIFEWIPETIRGA
jgi:hypothetical protein